MPGYDLQVLDDAAATPVKPGEIGALAIKLPLPPGCLPTLWNADERFRKTYLAEFPGYYKTGDAGYIDEDGYVYVMAAPTTSSTSPATASRPARWRRCSPGTRTSPNAP